MQRIIKPGLESFETQKQHIKWFNKYLFGPFSLKTILSTSWKIVKKNSITPQQNLFVQKSLKKNYILESNLNINLQIM